MSSTRFAFPALLAGAACIGFAGIFVRLSDIGPVATGFWRLLLAAPVLWLLSLPTPAPPINHRRGLALLAIGAAESRKLRAARRTVRELETGFCFDDGMLDRAHVVLDRPARRRAIVRLLDRHVIGWFLDTRLVGAEHTLIDPEAVARLHERGVAVGTHTMFPLGSTTGKPIDPAAVDAREVERLVAAGVDWIESDDPVRLMECLARL